MNWRAILGPGATALPLIVGRQAPMSGIYRDVASGYVKASRREVNSKLRQAAHCRLRSETSIYARRAVLKRRKAS
jgi:hypothetical protein